MGIVRRCGGRGVPEWVTKRLPDRAMAANLVTCHLHSAQLDVPWPVSIKRPSEGVTRSAPLS